MDSLWQAISAWIGHAKTCTGESLSYTPCQPFWQQVGLGLFLVGLLGTAAIVVYMLHRKKVEARKTEAMMRKAQRVREVDDEELRKAIWKVKEGPDSGFRRNT